MATARITDGVFAVNKPAGVSSAQVLRDLQRIFRTSNLFANVLEEEREKQARKKKPRGKKWQRYNTEVDVKIGHGGTLDPMATGVLIAGIGQGTKSLRSFSVDCIKSYDAIALFGCSTDTYDSEGKIVERTPYSHITRDVVEGALPKFRGNIQQKPPIYSALHVNGMRMYEYARQGLPLPTEIKSRPVTVENYEILKFVPGFGPNAHSWVYPAETAPEQISGILSSMESLRDGDETAVAETTRTDDTGDIGNAGGRGDISAARKRQAAEEDEAQEAPAEGADSSHMAKKLKTDPSNNVETSTAGATASEDASPQLGTGPDNSSRTQQNSPKEEENVGFHEADPPPAVHLSMTVSSGTYVRSLIHDLGKEVGSSAHMVALVRTRQGEFELGKNVLEWELFSQENGSKWEKELENALEKWNMMNLH